MFCRFVKMSWKTPNLVFFDLETTGLKSPDILQVGAVNYEGTDSFDDFAYPEQPIDPGATAVNNLSASTRASTIQR